jgi:hypothetical protein
LIRSDQAENNDETNITGTKFEVWVKKFCNKSLKVEDSSWQDKLLVVTEKRIFILSQKETKKARYGSTASFTEEPQSELEIADSIPMEEIMTAQIEEEKDGKWEENCSEFMPSSFWERVHERIDTFYSRWFEHPEENANSQDSDKQQRKDDLEKIQEMLRLGIGEESQNCCDRILRIITHPTGFNRGIAFYFLVKKDPISAVKSRMDLENAVLESRLTELAKQLSHLAAKRRADHRRETRFRRFQHALQYVWDSTAFNLVVLGLIVSNFIFTVQQLENNDPGRQRFFESVDLAYTIIFTIGE